ncbi:unnamed protein product, partial [Oncorhynchus mykiss]
LYHTLSHHLSHHHLSQIPTTNSPTTFTTTPNTHLSHHHLSHNPNHHLSHHNLSHNPHHHLSYNPTTTSPTTITSPPPLPPPPRPPPLLWSVSTVSQVCICPDEWTGETCSDGTFTVHTTTLLCLILDLTFTVHTTTLLYLTLDLTFRMYISCLHVEMLFMSIGNFCNSTSKDGFSFLRTVVGWSAYSVESCDEKTTSASARCLNDTGSPMFGPPHILQCELTLSDIQGNISSSSGDLLQLAFSTQILTNQKHQLSADNITTAAQIANTLLKSAKITEDIAVAAITTISQLLNANKESTQERDAVQSLTETLEKFSLDQHNNVSLVVQPNLAVQSVQVPSDSVGIQFTALTGSSGNFVAKRINLNTNTSELIADKGGSTDVQIVIKFPPVLRSKNTNHSIGLCSTKTTGSSGPRLSELLQAPAEGSSLLTWDKCLGYMLRCSSSPQLFPTPPSMTLPACHGTTR